MLYGDGVSNTAENSSVFSLIRSCRSKGMWAVKLVPANPLEFLNGGAG